MSKRKYVFQKPDGSPSKPVGLTTLMAAASARVVVGKGPFTLTQDGKAIVKDRPRRAVLKRFRTAISNRELGEVFRIRNKQKVFFTARAVKLVRPIAPCPDPNATPGVKRCWDAVQLATRAREEQIGKKLDVVFMGIYNCRRISGSSTWSQHAWRNGLDFRIRRTGWLTDSIDVESTTYVVYQTRQVAAESLWQSSGHTYHAHLTGDPKRFGTPPCA